MNAPTIISVRAFCAVGAGILLLAPAGCEHGIGPDLEHDPDRVVADQRAAALTERPEIDSLATVIEPLGPPGPVLRKLAENECVLHYRRGERGYTPVPFRLRISSEAEDERPAGSFVLYKRRSDVVAVRALCRFPRTTQAVAEAREQLVERLMQPGFARKQEEERISAVEADRDASTAGRWAAATMATLRTVISKIGPTVLYAQDGCVEDGGDPDNPPEEPCELPPIDAGGEDPCDDNYGYYDDYWDECVCYNGEDWGDPGGGDEPCQYSEPDPTDPGGGGDPGGPGDGDGDEPPPPPCPYEVQDTLVKEYEGGSGLTTVYLSPECNDFTNSGGSTNFEWKEFNDNWTGGGNPHTGWGMVKQSLYTGLETARSIYNRGGILLTSGYRCPHGNFDVGGELNSYHMHGRAADMYSADYGGKNWTLEECERLRNAVIQSNSTNVLSCTHYTDKHLHARW